MNLSRIVLGIGITLSVAFVLSLYVTPVPAQNQSSSTSASNTTTTDITIPQGASAQQVNQFYAVNATVPKDSSVTWTNKDIAPHTATADDGSFDAGTINPGSSASAMIKG